MPRYDKPLFSRILPPPGPSIFSEMSQKSKQHGALNLSQGFPDFEVSTELITLVDIAMVSGKNQYAPTAGLMELREEISKKQQDLQGCYYNPETEITVTAGATQAIFTTLMALLREGDDVIIFEPAYDCYAPSIRCAGASPVPIPLDSITSTYDWAMVKRAINPAKTKMIIFNTPHNPMGTILKTGDFLQIIDLIRNTDIIILADEVYEHITFDNNKHISFSSFPELAERTVVVSSFGKTFHTTGWKVGYCLGPEKIMKEIRKVHEINVFSVNTPIQFAYTEFLRKKENYSGVSAFYQEKRNYFLDLIKKSKFTFTPAQGTYFQILDYSEISENHSRQFADWLNETHKLTTIPIAPFYRGETNIKKIRLCFAKENETLEQAAEILCSI